MSLKEKTVVLRLSNEPQVNGSICVPLCLCCIKCAGGAGLCWLLQVVMSEEGLCSPSFSRQTERRREWSLGSGDKWPI